MKTIVSRSALALFSAALIGTFAATAFAGPSSQLWAKPSPATPKHAPAAAACAGCATTTTWAASNRGPSGQTSQSPSVASKSHGCSSCDGTPKAKMVPSSACGALACCR